MTTLGIIQTLNLCITETLGPEVSYETMTIQRDESMRRVK